MHIEKLINIFHQKYLQKLIATSLIIDSALPMAKSLVSKKPKQKHGRPSKVATKKIEILMLG